MAKELFSLCISNKKLHELKNGKANVVTHKKTLRWKSFASKKRTKVRFFDLQLFEYGVFQIKTVSETKSLGETIVRIEIIKEINV